MFKLKKAKIEKDILEHLSRNGYSVTEENRSLYVIKSKFLNLHYTYPTLEIMYFAKDEILIISISCFNNIMLDKVKTIPMSEVENITLYKKFLYNKLTMKVNGKKKKYNIPKGLKMPKWHKDNFSILCNELR
ncbi:hypothetical protein N072000002_04960 [Clostridium tetani]|uniref:YokE-like PH domain-containing protein n=1 Tax=Clostridium tetani TaxID=1513 RepID=A0A4Q0VBL0_CLOTA|nr:hypothetical protein [Clostridium tetani]RXI45362.1 hypothetical protein DP130_12170 [Clostridium tetani]BDR66269.1 hypothetical protein K144312032_04970 [Clostridium tetani]BDR80245.1 hypothetical protein K234311028_04910 [Clostridium tetani]BDR88695.1 hypothetical protein N072000002_04960 [Clostridium tetani]